jgi:hypothetical protein
MAARRVVGQSATLLPDGKVLVTAYIRNQQHLGELYTP